MAQADGVVANGTGAAVRADLNDQLAAVFTNHSGSSEPSTTYAYQWWADTTANVLKIRNSANNAWITLRELDGTLLMEDGSNSAPGLSFASDTNTGFFSGGADKIGFATGGVERLEIGSSEVVFNDPSNDVDFRVESNGNTHMLFVDAGNDRVGIGTSAPGDTFEVKAGFPVIAMLDSDTTNDKFRIVHNGGSTQLQVDPNNVSSSSHLLVSVDGSEAARIDSSGRLLVGTSSARSVSSLNSSLQVEGTGGDSSTISVTRNVASAAPPRVVLGKSRGTSVGSSIVVQSGDSLGEVSFSGADGTDANSVAATILCQVDGTPGSNDMPGRLMFNTTADGASSPTERVRIDSSGNVGIATSSISGANLVIATNSEGGSGIKLIGKSANGGAEIDFRNNADDTLNGFIEFQDTGGILSTVVNKPQVFRTNNTERMRIDSSGAVLINRTSKSDSEKLSVKYPPANQGVIIDTDAAFTGNSVLMEFKANGTTGGSIAFTNNGTSTAYVGSSDYRLKENVVDLVGAITRVKQLSPKRFNFIADANTTVDGFLAHEAQTVVPEAVTGTHNEVDDDGNAVMQGIDQSKLVPLLTAALQEAIAKIETLETKVAALEAG